MLLLSTDLRMVVREGVEKLQTAYKLNKYLVESINIQVLTN